jgi:hypothetical protein
MHDRLCGGSSGDGKCDKNGGNWSVAMLGRGRQMFLEDRGDKPRGSGCGGGELASRGASPHGIVFLLNRHWQGGKFCGVAGMNAVAGPRG